MTIAEMLSEVLTGGIEKSDLARRLGITRQTLDHWLGGLYVPEPWVRKGRKVSPVVDRLALELGRKRGEILAAILLQKGVAPADLRSIGAYAKGLYVSSPSAA